MAVDKRMIVLALVLALLAAPGARGQANVPKDNESYYTEKPMFLPAPTIGKSWNIKNFGPVGIGIDLVPPGFTMKITNVEAGSPADKTGKLKPGQIIESINGQVLKDRDPRVILGDIITEAEAKDGKINLKIQGEGNVLVQIPVMGSYSPTWPLNCPKSDKIVRNLADLLAKQEKPTWGSALFLLSTGEEQDLAVVRKWFTDLEMIGNGEYPWHAGYLGLAVCEYYLRTGDESVLPAIEKMCASLKETMYDGGWSGRGHGSSLTYGPGAGQLHAAGVHCVTFLQLAKMCGAEVDDYMFAESLKNFYRYAGHENVPYGNSWPEGGFRDNGKSAGLAVAMSAAAQLTPEGENSIYAKARDSVAMKSFYATNWFHAAHTGGGMGEIWHNAAMSMIAERRPAQHRSFVDTRRWVMDLSRRWDGSIGIAGMTDQYDESASESEHSWGNYFALTYTIQRKNLITFGAPKTKWCQSHQLPVRPWGREADDAFVQIEPISGSPEHLSMNDLLKEEVATDASLPVFARLAADDVDDDTLWKYLKHPEIGLRIAAMRSVVNKGRTDFVLPLLRSEDPRARHAGLLAITGMFKEGGFSNDKLTPEMFVLAGKMIEDSDEALWVVQQAMLAMSRADPQSIAKHKDAIASYMDHEDWYLRVRAIEALVPICADSAHYRSILPKMFDTLSRFTTPNGLSPMRNMDKQLTRASEEVKTFAFEELKKAYLGVPPVMKFHGGRIMADGSQTVRKSMAGSFTTLPGGSDFLKGQPMATLESMRSGDVADMYRYTPPPKRNPAMEGSWILLNPGNSNLSDKKKMESMLEDFGRKFSENPEIRKGWGELKLDPGGKIKADRGNYKGYFWSGDMLIDPFSGMASKMLLSQVDGFDFLVFETVSIDGTSDDAQYEADYKLYVRAESHGREPGKGKNAKWLGTAIQSSGGLQSSAPAPAPEPKPDHAPAPAFEPWTGSNGKILQARFISLVGEQITLEMKDGKTYTMPLTSLAEVSRQRAMAHKAKQQK